MCESVSGRESYRGFIITGDLAKTGKAQNLYGIENGDSITVIIAPRYFGDGYLYPIAGLSKDGKQVISFDEGYLNLMEYYK